MSNKDMVRGGTEENLLKYYDVLEQETQSHKNCYTCTLVDKKNGDHRFCKVITKTEEMPLKALQKTVEFMTSVSDSMIIKIQEVY